MDKSKQGRSNRRKGKRIENEVVHRFNELGIHAEKVSRSGYTGEDIVIDDAYTVEVKARQDGFKRLRDWLDDVDFLVLRKIGDPRHMVVMDIETLGHLWSGGYGSVNLDIDRLGRS